MFLMKYSRHNDITSEVICAVIDCHVCRSLYGSDTRVWSHFLCGARGVVNLHVSV